MPLKVEKIVLSQYLQRYLTKIFLEPGIQKLSINKTKLDLLYPIYGKTLFFSLKKEILIVNVITELPKINYSAIVTKFYKRPLKIFRNIYNIYFLVGKQITPKIKNYFFSFSLTKVLQLCCLHQVDLGSERCTYNAKNQQPLNVHFLPPRVLPRACLGLGCVNQKSTGQSTAYREGISQRDNTYLQRTVNTRRSLANSYYLKKKLITLENLDYILNYLTKKTNSTNTYNTFFIHQLEQDTLYVSSSFKEKTKINYILSKKLFNRKLLIFQNHSIFFYQFQLIRPLFFITRLDTFYVCESLKLPNYPDRTNLQVKFLRNRIRKQILPAIRILLNPQIDIIVCNFSESFYDL